ncbi:MAG: hypothetical protein Satyrvirus6_38 [Satyrvirus sp.]|uniref:Uncharacterized protein n=1 Tax=Satyrvirus sp. TaxID=2487771 RepID=A0A3G5ADA9_9VIRU|nr:MAG: hypothetical protein Satyrvirus6_38 [Satyrvirus sp.]
MLVAAKIWNLANPEHNDYRKVIEESLNKKLSTYQHMN